MRDGTSVQAPIPQTRLGRRAADSFDGKISKPKENHLVACRQLDSSQAHGPGCDYLVGNAKRIRLPRLAGLAAPARTPKSITLVSNIGQDNARQNGAFGNDHARQLTTGTTPPATR